jgi:hypothetical protein
MSIRADSGPVLPGLGGSGGDFMLLGDLVEIHRQHFPAGQVRTSEAPLTPDDCRVVDQREIQPFRFDGPERWADYRDIVAAFDRLKEAGTRRRPYPREAVFAPAKIVLAERDHPLRAVVAGEAVYPARGKMAVGRPGQPLPLLYAATAVLNSPLGEACYRELVRRSRGREGSPSGLDKEALSLLPVAHRDAAPEELERAALLCNRIQALHRAEGECRRSFRQPIRLLQRRLPAVVAGLLHLTAAEARRLLASVPDLPPPKVRFRPGEEAEPLPSVQLLTPEQAERHAALAARNGSRSPAEEAEFSRLQRLRNWEERVNACCCCEWICR